MVAINQDLTEPTTPPADWGITKRKLSIKDWRPTIWSGVGFTISALLLLGVRILQSNTNNESSLAVSENFLEVSNIISITFMVCAGLVSFFATAIALSLPNEELHEARKDAFRSWEKNKLIPFLEARYGFKFAPNAQVYSFWGAPTYVSHKGKQIKIRINGVTVKHTEGDRPTPYVVISPAGITVEEIVDRRFSYVEIDPI